MNVFSLVTFMAFGVSILLGVYARRLDPRSRANRVFFWFCVSLAVWALAYTFLWQKVGR